MWKVELKADVQAKQRTKFRLVVHSSSCSKKQKDLVRHFFPRSDVDNEFGRNLRLSLAMQFSNQLEPTRQFDPPSSTP